MFGTSGDRWRYGALSIVHTKTLWILPMKWVNRAKVQRNTPCCKQVRGPRFRSSSDFALDHLCPVSMMLPRSGMWAPSTRRRGLLVLAFWWHPRKKWWNVIEGFDNRKITSKFPTLKGLSKKVRSETTLVNVLWKHLFGLLWDHFGECAVEELLWASQGSLWWVCCGRATTLGPLGYSGITLASVLWKNYFGLVRDHFGECTVEELLLASQGSLWWVRCGRATLGYSGITLVSVVWKSYFGLQGSLWWARCGRATLG